MAELLAFLSFGIAEHLAAWRTARVLGARWIANFTLIGTNVILSRLILPGGLAGVAFYAQKTGIGFLGALSLPAWTQWVIGFLLLDGTSYALHRLTHRFHLLWRFHAVHHADPEVDVTTGFRHHPGELILVAFANVGMIFIAGIPAAAVAAYNVVAAFSQVAQHGNFKVPRLLDAALRYVVITPDVHRLHHSIHAEMSDRNYGTVLIWWDRLFRTYLPESGIVERDLQFGLHGFSERRDLAPWRVLAMPLLMRRNPPSGYRAFRASMG